MFVEFFVDDWKFVYLQFYGKTQIVPYLLPTDQQRVVWKIDLSELNYVKCEKEWKIEIQQIREQCLAYSDVSVETLWPTPTNLLNNKFSPFLVKLTAIPPNWIVCLLLL